MGRAGGEFPGRFAETEVDGGGDHAEVCLTLTFVVGLAGIQHAACPLVGSNYFRGAEAAGVAPGWKCTQTPSALLRTARAKNRMVQPYSTYFTTYTRVACR